MKQKKSSRDFLSVYHFDHHFRTSTPILKKLFQSCNLSKGSFNIFFEVGMYLCGQKTRNKVHKAGILPSKDRVLKKTIFSIISVLKDFFKVSFILG